MDEGLQLDQDIRSNVLVPIFLVVILVAIIRQNIVGILRTDTATDLKDVKSNQLINRCQNLKNNGMWLPERAFRARKAFYNKKDVGILWTPPQAPNPLQALSNQDPSHAVGMLKSQMSFVILNGGLAYLINFLFSGFLVAKAPFPLTYRFRSMLQRGIDVPSLDVTYVSSLSWYFFVMLSSTGFMSIINHLTGQELELGDKNAMDVNNPMSQMNPAAVMLPGVGGPDLKKVYAQERDSLELINHTFALSRIEEKLLASWKRASR